MALFLAPPKIDPAEILPAAVAQKIAGTRLMSPPAGWTDEVLQTLSREYPFIPLDRALLTFRNKDDSRGFAIGHISINGAGSIRIPVVIRDWELAPLDIMIIKTSRDQDVEQGSGDADDDLVVPLTEQTFNQALDSGSPGTLVQPNLVRGAAWTEDGSSLRLPYRGRVVVASALGATQQQREALVDLLRKDQKIAAGFVIHKTAEAINGWLNAPEPKKTLATKLASTPIERGHAQRLQMMPEEKKTAELVAARVFVEGDKVKTAISFQGVDLANPSQPTHWLAFEDGSCVRAPEKVAVVAGDDQAALGNRVISKIASQTFQRNTEVVLCVNDYMTSPLKVASIAVDGASNAIFVGFESLMGQKVPVVFQPGIKVATYTNGAWVMPVDTRVLRVVTGAEDRPAPIEPAKLAERIVAHFPDELRCCAGAYTLAIHGEPAGVVQADEKTAAARLSLMIDNADEVLAWAKEASAQAAPYSGVVRFDAQLDAVQAKTAAKLADYHSFPQVAKEFIASVGLPLEAAVKLAASISDPDAVDSVLGTGFLTEDNLSEFFGMAGQFEETVEKLARLLYAIRLGLPGDETATSVAMKALQRVTDRLKSISGGM